MVADQRRMTYDEVVVALGDAVAAEARVQVYIAGQSGAFVAGLSGRLLHETGPLVNEDLRQMYVGHGGDEDMDVFYVDGGQEHGFPCFVLCRSFFRTAHAIHQAALGEGAAAGAFWRALIIYVGGVAVSVGVEAVADAT